MKLKSIVKKMEKNQDNLVYYGSALRNLNIERCSTGVFILDYLLGGGIPLGKFIMFHGTKMTSKSTISYKVANEHFKKFPDKKVLLVDFEHSYSVEWASHFLPEEVLSKESFFVVRPDYGEQGIDIMKECALAEDLGMIIVDSLAMMIPTSEAEASALDDFRGLQARLINKMFRKLITIQSHVAKSQNRLLTILLINQVRANFGARAFQSQISKPGGFMQDHIVAVDVKFYSGKFAKVKGVPVKVEQIFTIEKSRVSIPRTSGKFVMYLQKYDGHSVGEIEEIGDILNSAKVHGLLVRESNKWNVLGLDSSFKNLAEIQVKLSEDEDFRSLLKDKIIEASKESLAKVELEGNFSGDGEVEGTE
jgi:recombination protein RecA